MRPKTPPPPAPAPDLFADGAKTVKKAAEWSGVSRSELYRLMDAGKLPYTRRGRDRLIPVAALKAVLNENLVPALPEGGAK